MDKRPSPSTLLLQQSKQFNPHSLLSSKRPICLLQCPHLSLRELNESVPGQQVGMFPLHLTQTSASVVFKNEISFWHRQAIDFET